MNCQCFNIFLTIKGVVSLQLGVSSSGASVKVPITPVKSKSVDGFNVMSVEDAEFELRSLVQFRQCSMKIPKNRSINIPEGIGTMSRFVAQN